MQTTSRVAIDDAHTHRGTNKDNVRGTLKDKNK